MQIKPVTIRLEYDAPQKKNHYGKVLFFVVVFVGIIVLYM